MSTATFQCPSCARTFVHAKRLATHAAMCNPPAPASGLAPPEAVTVDDVLYFCADDLARFFPDTKSGRDVVSASNAPEDQVTFATYSPKKGVWKVSTETVKVSRALLRAPWARANVPGLDDLLSAPPSTTLPPDPSSLLKSASRSARPSMTEIIEGLRLKTLELDLARAQIALMSAHACERRAAELHERELDALERRTAAFVASPRG